MIGGMRNGIFLAILGPIHPNQGHPNAEYQGDKLMNSFKTRVLAAMVACMALMAGTQAAAQDAVSVQADGSVAVSIEDERFVIPAPVAEAVELAVTENADDPEALRLAIQAIISQNAGAPEAAGLATAIAAFAVFHAGSNSPSIAAIALAATGGNSGVSGGSVIAAIPTLRAESGSPEEAVEREIAQAQATVENPAQVSPVQ